MARPNDKANELVTITTTASVLDAELLCAVLRAAGIKAFVPNENSSTMLPHMIQAINPNGVPVMVRSADAQAAQAVLADKAAPPPPSRMGNRGGADRPGGRKDDRYAPPAGPEEDQGEDEAWGEAQDEEEDDGVGYDDRYYDEDGDEQDEDEDGAFDEDDRDGDEYAGDDEEGPPVDGRCDQWDGAPPGRDRDGRQRDGGERRTLKFDDYQDKDFRNSGKTDWSDRSDGPSLADDESEQSDESDDGSDFEDYEGDEEDDQAPPETSADRHAAAAARSILFTWWFPPAALWTLYCISQAMQARQVEPPAQPEQFQSNLWCAVLAGLGSAVLASIVYYHVFANW
jgi:hypothetical protein